MQGTQCETRSQDPGITTESKADAQLLSHSDVPVVFNRAEDAAFYFYFWGEDAAFYLQNKIIEYFSFS